jgi:hypothetical protein
MTSKSLEQVSAPAPVQAPGFIGQATAVEQARAVAEVQAAVYVAQQMPRDMQAAIAAMRESTDFLGLAERAFFSYSRAGSSITGPTIHLARELARIWGNVQYGIAELRRDDDAGVSEMQAYAWDLQTNTRSATIFIVPHKRDTKQGTKAIVELRDVYENNANQGSRRVREQIFAILPPWFKDEAIDRCAATLRRGSDAGQTAKPLATRVADAVRKFESLGVTADQLEVRVGRSRAKWNEHDVAQLAILFRTIERGEARKDDEFPQQRVTTAEITGQQPTQTAGGGSGEAAPPAPTPEPSEHARETQAAAAASWGDS